MKPTIISQSIIDKASGRYDVEVERDGCRWLAEVAPSSEGGLMVHLLGCADAPAHELEGEILTHTVSYWTVAAETAPETVAAEVVRLLGTLHPVAPRSDRPTSDGAMQFTIVHKPCYLIEHTCEDGRRWRTEVSQGLAGDLQVNVFGLTEAPADWTYGDDIAHDVMSTYLALGTPPEQVAKLVQELLAVLPAAG